MFSSKEVASWHGMKNGKNIKETIPFNGALLSFQGGNGKKKLENGEFAGYLNKNAVNSVFEL